MARWRGLDDFRSTDVGRDPATLERTATVLVDLPGATGREGWGALTGLPEEIAEGLRAYARAGFSHVQFWLEPSTIQGLAAFARRWNSSIAADAPCLARLRPAAYG